MTTIHFKSTPDNFAKEKDGRKPNTLRTERSFFEKPEAQYAQFADNGRFCRNPIHRIVIENTETHETFEREITDITFWQGWVIISWKHEGD